MNFAAQEYQMKTAHPHQMNIFMTIVSAGVDICLRELN